MLVYPLASYFVGLAVRSMASTLILQDSVSTARRFGIFVACDVLSLVVHVLEGFALVALYVAPYIQQLLEFHGIAACSTTACILYWSMSGLADLFAAAAVFTIYSTLVRRGRLKPAQAAMKARFVCTFVVAVLCLAIMNYSAYTLISTELHKLDMGFPRD
jgi:hypothetical protein